MTDLAQKQAPQRRGFSLVLSLTIMAMILLMVITLASFLSIEARLATANQLRTQARMQALVSLRLALAHLQQEAGPDRRTTFRAEITKGIQQAKTYAELQNPMWTGVQRTDYPFQPPSWIISGRGDKYAGSQSVSIAPGGSNWPSAANINTSNPAMLESNTPMIANYTLDQWLPWQTDYIPQNLIILVGDATATGAEEIKSNDPLSGRPDGRVSLPAVSFPDNLVNGRYCYWVGDEGVKANVSPIDLRVTGTNLTNPNPTDTNLVNARRGVSRTGSEILSEMSNLTFIEIDEINKRVDKLNQLNFINLFTTDSDKSLWPDITVSSYGLFADSRFGGLKIDLTRVFEMDDSDFLSSEWGTGKGRSTFYFNGEQSYLLKNANHALFKDDEGKMFINYNNVQNRRFATVWSFPETSDSVSPSTNPAIVRGPTWSALRDYYRLYKQLDFTTSPPSIAARTHYPNTVALSQSDYPTELTVKHYSQIYNRTDCPRKFYKGTGNIFSSSNWNNDFINYTANDFIKIRAPSITGQYNGTQSGLFARPIPTKVAVQPYIARQQLVFGLISVSGKVKLTISPVTVLHNPYNVTLKLGKQRISFRNFLDQEGVSNTLYTRAIRTYTDSNTDPITGKSYDVWYPKNGVLGLIQKTDSTANNNECLRFDIEDIDLKPGEFKVFTVQGDSFYPSRKLTMQQGYRLSGFMADYLDNSKTIKNNEDGTKTAESTPMPLVFPPTNSTLQIGLDTCNLNPKFNFRHLMVSWGVPGRISGDDSLPGNDDNLTNSDTSNENELYNKCSIIAEHAALPFTEQSRNGSVLGSYTSIDSLPNPDVKIGQSRLMAISSLNDTQPFILGIFDYSIRWPNDSKSGSIYTSGAQLFARTNPMAAVTRADSSDQAWDNKLDMYPPSAPLGYANTSVSYKLEIKNGTWPTLDHTGDSGYGGSSNTSSGQTSAVYTEVPLSPPQSIAQFAHANYKLFDQSPLLGAGNSLYPLQSIWKNPYNHGALYCGGYWDSNPYLVECDDNFYTNRALFDRFFLSGITSNLSDFSKGITSLTDNQRTTLFSNKTPNDIESILKNPRRASSVLINKGQFNVHSMSIRAWAAILAGAKAKRLSNETGGTQTDARFPRAIRNDVVQTSIYASTINPRDFSNSAAWGGITALNDDQIKNLAKNIVWENQFRISFSHREGNINVLGTGQSGWHKSFCNNNAMLTAYGGIQLRGLKSSPATSNYPVPAPSLLVFNTNNALPNPYQGLSQFINRHGCPHVGEAGFNMGAGALHNAILHTDNEPQNSSIPTVMNQLNNRYGTNLSGAMIMKLDGPVSINTATGNPNSVPYYFIDNTSTTSASRIVGRFDAKKHFDAFNSPNYGDLRIGSPTALLPSDILSAIGSSLSTRSDTFTIRAYGDVTDKAGSPAAGACWIEAVVQRIPDFIDDSQLPETDVCNLDASWKHNPNLLPINAVLGRRFIILSCRILKSNEL